MINKNIIKKIGSPKIFVFTVIWLMVLVFVGVFQLCVYLSLIYFLIPKMNVLWISENIAKIVDRNQNDVDEILNYGFNEPSLIFLTSHKSKKIDPHILKENTIFSKKIMYIVSSEYSEIFFKNPKYSDLSVYLSQM